MTEVINDIVIARELISLIDDGHVPLMSGAIWVSGGYLYYRAGNETRVLSGAIWSLLG